MSITSLVFHATERCQLSCRHCLRDPGRKPLDLAAELVERVLHQARRIYCTPHVSFTGGEPVLHPRLDLLLDSVVQQGMTWHLVTSGRGFERLLALLHASAPRREALTAIDFSLDGATPAVHDNIRGPGQHREVLSGVLRCKAAGIPFVLQMTLHAGNVDELEQAGLLAAELGADRISFGMMQATGTPSDKALYLSPGQWRSAFDRVQRLARMLTLPVSWTEGFPVEQPLHVCGALRSETMHVDVRGRLTLCCQLSGIPGEQEQDVLADLADLPLVEAHQRHLVLSHRLQLEALQRLSSSAERAACGEQAQVDALEQPFGWHSFPCNECMKRFCRPYWVDGGSAGPRANKVHARPAVADQ